MTTSIMNKLIAAACLLLAGLLIYANSFSAPFVFDDHGLVVDNPRIMTADVTLETIKNLCREPSPNRPLAMLTFAANYWIHKFDVSGFHLVNILIHVLNGWLVFCLARQTLRQNGVEKDPAALLAALVWLAMPLHTQSVTYIVQRMTSLAALFFLLSLVCYIKARELRIRGAGLKRTCFWFAGCGLSFLLGLACKETVVMLPVFIFLYEWLFFQNLDRAWLKKHWVWPALALALGGLVALLYFSGHPMKMISDSYKGLPFTPTQRLLTQPRVILYYLSLLAWPHPDRLVLGYDFPLSNGLTSPAVTLPAIIALAALVAAALFTARKNRLPAFAILWFLGNLAIESSVIGLALIFEHRTYLPSIFPVIFGSALLVRFSRSKRAMIILFCVIIGVGGIWTRQRNYTWQDNAALWQDSVDKSPANPRPCYNLALALDQKGDYLAAIRFFRKSLDLIKARPGNEHLKIADINNGLGTAFLETGLYREAREHFQTALRILTEMPDVGPLYIAEVQNNLGMAFLKSQNTGQALVHIRKAMTVRLKISGPDSLELAGSLNNLGLIHSQQNEYAQAATCFQRALAIFREKLGVEAAKTATAYNNLGMAEQHLQNPVKALEYFGQALAIRSKTAGPMHPETAETWNNLGVVYRSMGNNRLAATCYRRALAIFRDKLGDDHPSTRAARDNLFKLQKSMDATP